MINKSELKSYDIALFEVEQKYNKKLIPIENKIDKLSSQYESKSLNSHKDFLAKEEKSKEYIATLEDKHKERIQKIEQVASNKLSKLQAKKEKITKSLDAFKKEQDELRNKEIALIHQNIEELKDEEESKKRDVKEKFKINVESYSEKLDIYNDNFEENNQFHKDAIKSYQEKLDQQLEDIERLHETLMETVTTRLTEQMKKHEDNGLVISSIQEEGIKKINQIETSVRKQVNIELDSIDKYISALKREESSHYQEMISNLKNQAYELRTSFEERRLLIEADLKLNTDKQLDLLENDETTLSRKAMKNINNKLELFKDRASTVIQYEETLLEKQTDLIEAEIKLLEERLKDELLNIDKLEVFLLHDENQTKDTATYFKDLNTVLRNELSNFQYSNNEYTKKHSELKAEFNRNYIKIFKNLKETLVAVAQMHLNKMSENNFEIDRISAFLDTAEPQKEVRVNTLREDIEINEISERFKMKYAKEEYDLNMIHDRYNAIIIKQEEKNKELISELQLDILEVKNKQVYDKLVERSKMQLSKALEELKGKKNSTASETELLENNYHSKKDILELEKDIAEIKVRKHTALHSKELDLALQTHQLEIKYQTEIIKKSLEESVFALEEKVFTTQTEKEDYIALWTKTSKEKVAGLLEEKEAIIDRANDKRDLVKIALERELKEPSYNKLRTEAIIDERMSKLDFNNAIFVDFIRDTIDTYRDDLLSTEQLREVIINNELLEDKSEKYIIRLYQVLREAVEFMNNIEKQSIINKMDTVADKAKLRKLKKQLDKHIVESDKQLQHIDRSEQDHIIVHKNVIEAEIVKVKNANVDDNKELVTVAENAYYLIFDRLKSLHENVKSETEQLYEALTKNDAEAIYYANEHAAEALSKIDSQEESELEPVLKKIENIQDELVSEKEGRLLLFDQVLSELKAEINHVTNEAQSKIKELTKEKSDLIDRIKEQRHSLLEDEESRVVTEKERIDSESKALDLTYQEMQDRIDMKNKEAQKMYEYEDNIHKIAVENAASRYNESNTKAKSIHEENTKRYRKHTIEAEKTVERNNKNYDKTLQDLSKQFERNIFTTRPRLEESIGDVQKEIDIEIDEKRKELDLLLLHNEKLLEACESHLCTSFDEGYDKLRSNLSSYLEKYRLIEEEFISKTNLANESINASSTAFSKALFQMSKNKHENNVKELARINKSISKEEEL